MEMKREDVFSQAAEMHFGFESIHPFSDGNGRVGRLLLNIHFLNHNWPLIHILPHDRNSYLDALETAHFNGVAKLTEFLETNMASSLIFVLDKVGSEEEREMIFSTLGGEHLEPVILTFTILHCPASIRIPRKIILCKSNELFILISRILPLTTSARAERF